jgi:hypothetical protein
MAVYVLGECPGGAGHMPPGSSKALTGDRVDGVPGRAAKVGVGGTVPVCVLAVPLAVGIIHLGILTEAQLRSRPHVKEANGSGSDTVSHWPLHAKQGRACGCRC